jgi:hypothetical protein
LYDVSLARTKAKMPRDLRSGMEIVEACERIVRQCQYKLPSPTTKITTLKFWALENPFGFLVYLLGKPALIFNPFDFGDPYQKKTCLWGHFNEPKKSPVEIPPADKIKFATNSQNLRPLPAEGLPLFGKDGYKLPPDMNRRQARRAITPPGFANAFFKSNQ